MLDSTQPGWAQCLQRAAAPPSHAHPLAQYLAHALQQGQPPAQAHGPALLLEAWLAGGIRHTTFARAQPAHWRASASSNPAGVPSTGSGCNNGQRANGTRKSPVADLARRAHLSPSQFTARCRDELGLGAIEWLRQQRLAHARLLRASGMPVAAVASATGYRSPSALTAALRRDRAGRAGRRKPSDPKARLSAPATAATTIAARRCSGAARRWSALQNAYSRRMLPLPCKPISTPWAPSPCGLLASLGVSLTHIPPFLLTGITLIIGSVPAWPFVLRDPSRWRIPMRTLALGVYGLFAYHFLLFIALRHAPPVEANLVNYLWPLFIVVLAPVVLPGVALRVPHVVAALLGFGGAAIAIVGGRELSGTLAWGYIPAAAAAFIWATYSLMTNASRPSPPPRLACSASFRRLVAAVPCAAGAQRGAAGARLGPTGRAGPGPLGGAFYLWDKALKLGDARHIGILSYITPLASTTLLIVVSGRSFSWSIGLATAMIISAAVMGMRAR